MRNNAFVQTLLAWGTQHPVLASAIGAVVLGVSAAGGYVALAHDGGDAVEAIDPAVQARNNAINQMASSREAALAASPDTRRVIGEGDLFTFDDLFEDGVSAVGQPCDASPNQSFSAVLARDTAGNLVMAFQRVALLDGDNRQSFIIGMQDEDVARRVVGDFCATGSATFSTGHINLHQQSYEAIGGIESDLLNSPNITISIGNYGTALNVRRAP